MHIIANYIYCAECQTSGAIGHNLEHVVLRTLRDSWGISSVASYLFSVVPETHKDESFHRSHIIMHELSHQKLEQSIWIVLFQLSNILFSETDIGESEWQNVFGLVKVSGLMNTPLQLRKTEDPTLLTITESLFRSALSIMYKILTGPKRQLYAINSYHVLKDTLGLLSWLLKSGRDPNAPIRLRRLNFSDLLTPLEVAIECCQYDLALTLLEKGASIDLCHQNYTSVEPLFIQAILHCNCSDPIKFAETDCVHFSFIKTHVGHGASVSATYGWTRGGEGRKKVFSKTKTILGSAVGVWPEWRALSMTEYLLQVLIHQDDPKDRFSAIIAESLLIAAEKGNIRVLELLLEYGHANMTNSTGYSPLHPAAYYGQKQACEFLLSRGADFEGDSSNLGIPSPLHLAAYGNHLEVVQLLARRGASIHRGVKPNLHTYYSWAIGGCRNIRGVHLCESPIHVAMVSCNAHNGKDTFRFLLNEGAKVPDWALWYGALREDFELVSLLVQKPIDYNSRGLDGRTPLQAVLDFQSQLDFHHLPFTESARSRLYTWTKEQMAIHANIAALLLDYGATLVGGEDVTCAGLGDWELMRRILDRNTSMDNCVSTHNETSYLREASKNGHTQIVHELLKRYPHVYHAGSLYDATHLACLDMHALPGCLDTTDSLLKLVAQLLKNRQDSQPAHQEEIFAIAIALLYDNMPVFEYLLNAIPASRMISPITNRPQIQLHLTKRLEHEIGEGAKRLRLSELMPESPLAYAYNRPSARALLLNRGWRADRDTLALGVITNNLEVIRELWPTYYRNARWSGRSLLQIAIKSGNLEMIRFLLDSGEDINEREDSGRDSRTPLQEAAEIGNLAVLNMLLKGGAELNAPALPNGGVTALQIACIRGFFGIVEKLISLGADVNAPRAKAFGRTALEEAAEHGRIDIIQLLLCHGANTRGQGRIQFIQAIKLAEHECHYSAVGILRSHREWDDTDEALYRSANDHIDQVDHNVYREDPRDTESVVDWAEMRHEIWDEGTKEYSDSSEARSSSESSNNSGADEQDCVSLMDGSELSGLDRDMELLGVGGDMDLDFEETSSDFPDFESWSGLDLSPFFEV